MQSQVNTGDIVNILKFPPTGGKDMYYVVAVETVVVPDDLTPSGPIIVKSEVLCMNRGAVMKQITALLDVNAGFEVRIITEVIR